MDTYITVREFVSVLYQEMKKDSEDALQKGLEKGWIDAADIYQLSSPLERRLAAKIIHQFLRQELQEKDNEDWTQAKQLQDLYDCRTCVNHVAQVYSKGIIGSCTEDNYIVFGMCRRITHPEASEIVKRIFYPMFRISPYIQAKIHWATGLITWQQAKQILEEYEATHQKYLLLDVRPLHEYEKGHIFGAINKTLSQILENANCVRIGKEVPILIYCEQGYQSEMAANCFMEEGYKNIFYFVWTKEAMKMGQDD